MKKEDPRWLEVFKVALPLCLSYVPIGLACGVVVNAAGFNIWLSALLSLLIFSGGAQFLIASMLTINAPINTILVMLFFLQLRYALLGASLSRYLRGTSKGFIHRFALSLNDENYAVNYLKFATDKQWTPKDALLLEHYSLIFWTVANVIGGLIGNIIPINVNIVDYALTALFLYMVVMQFKNRLTILISIWAGVCAVLAMMLFKSTMGLVVATLIASLTGFAIENYLIKHGKEKGYLLRVIKRKASRRVISKAGEDEL